MPKIPLITIVGPTASGKTTLSVEIAKRLNGEIISADSMQIYKYMDIGTAKATKSEMQGVPHYMINELEPSENFSVAQFSERVHEYIHDIYSRGKIPVMVGGTGLYVQAITDDVIFEKEDCDSAFRSELDYFAQLYGNSFLIDILRIFDPVSAQRLHPNNRRRVIRAIEFYKNTGTPISEHQEYTKTVQSRYNPIMFAVNWDRDVLYERINKRVDIMIETGLINEVQNLLAKGYLRTSTAMSAIGYKEIVNYLRGFCTLNEAVELIKRNSRRYAKRQLTWFRRDERIHWLKYTDTMTDTAVEIIKQSL